MSALMGVAGAWISPPPSHGLVADSGGMKAPGIVKQDGGKNKRIVGVNTDNEGVLTGDPTDGVKWTVTVPGGDLKDSDTLTIKDAYKLTGSTFTVKENGVTLYRVRNTEQCRRDTTAPDCSQTLYPEAGGAGGKATVKVDDDADTVDVTYANGANFTDEYIYVLEIDLKVKEKILPGTYFKNEAQVNGKSVRGFVIKEAGAEPAVGTVVLSKTFGNRIGPPPPINPPQFLPRPQALPNQGPGGNQVPDDAVFTVHYRYTYEGEERSGTLELKGPRWISDLYNVPVGAVVTLTEDEPAVAGVNFGDPEFSGRGVTDGVPDARSAQVTVPAAGGGLPAKTVVTLKNPIARKLAVVDVTPGVCSADSTQPSDPTVRIGESEDITYTQPQITKEGKQATVTITATPRPRSGKVIDEKNLPEGWKANGDGSFTFTKTVAQPDCAAVPAIPVVKAGVCPVDSVTPTQPSVTGVEDTDVIDYSEPVVAVDGDRVSVTVTATAKPGSRIDTANLPEGWAVVGGVVTYTTTVTQPKCVVPVVPKIDVGTCPVDSLTPSAPSASFDAVEGVEFSEPKVEVAAGKVTVTASAKTKAGFQFGGVLPEGWTRVDETTATFTAVKDQPVCGAPTPTPTVTPTPTPTVTPTPTPTVTPTPTPPPTPVHPGLPKTGA